MNEPTTHDVQMSRYTENWTPPLSEPVTGPTPAPALADLEAAMTGTPATVALADALKRLAEAREQVVMAESVVSAVAANLAGRN